MSFDPVASRKSRRSSKWFCFEKLRPVFVQWWCCVWVVARETTVIDRFC